MVNLLGWWVNWLGCWVRMDKLTWMILDDVQPANCRRSHVWNGSHHRVNTEQDVEKTMKNHGFPFGELSTLIVGFPHPLHVYRRVYRYFSDSLLHATTAHDTLCLHIGSHHSRQGSKNSQVKIIKIWALIQWISWRENLEETIDFPMKYGCFL